jgi:hypothetical protein
VSERERGFKNQFHHSLSVAFLSYLFVEKAREVKILPNRNLQPKPSKAPLERCIGEKAFKS